MFNSVVIRACRVRACAHIVFAVFNGRLFFRRGDKRLQRLRYPIEANSNLML